ncbi:hypothetical protein [Streptomyces albogriseolus]|uniref:hypothetical protein n=1 Tax=Streptomyces albogriseolus TaxID=1887 RepID=UPI003CE72225
MWKLTRPDNQHDKLTRDNLLDLQDHRLVRIELVREDQRQVWVLTKRGHGEAKKLLEPKGIRVSALREEKYDPDTGELLGASYDDHSAAVTTTAAELHRAGIGNRLGFATEIPHRLADGYVQRADLVVRAPEAGVPVMLLEIDRRTEDAHDLVTKLRRYWEWGRLLPKDAAKLTVDLVRSRPGAIEDVDHEKRLWRRVYPPTGREGLVPLAFVFADTTEAKVANTVAVLEETGRRYWAPRRYQSLYREAITAKDYSQAVPVVVTTLEQLQEHGADAAVWRRLGRKDEQTLTDALDNPDGDALYRRQYAHAEAEDERRRAAEREARRPVCKRCGRKFTDQRWEETTTHRTAWKAGDLSLCSDCHADDVARKEAAAEAARLQAATPPELEPEHDQEPGKLRGLFRRRG